MSKKNIVVAGAGFGGITAVLKLAKNFGALQKEYEIILIDQHHHQLYTPALYEIAAIPREYASDPSLKSALLIPITDTTSGKPITALCDEIIGLNYEDKKIVLKNRGELSYEFLVLALGSETNYFGIPGLKEYSLPLKTPDDGLRLRDAIEDGVRKNDGLKIIVGGAGPSGIELVAEFVNFICTLQKKIAPEKKTCDVQYTLVEASPEILTGFEPWLVKKARIRLETLGVKIKTDSAIASVNSQEVIFKNGGQEPYDILIWTGGVRGPSIFPGFSLPLSPKGSINVNEFLCVEGTNSRIFAIGDNSTFINPKTAQPLAWNVPIAEAEGKMVAQNIMRSIKGLSLIKFIPWKKYPFVLAIGKKYALADLVFLHVSGFLGWLIKLLIELRYLLFILPPQPALKRWLRNAKLYGSND